MKTQQKVYDYELSKAEGLRRGLDEYKSEIDKMKRKMQNNQANKTNRKHKSRSGIMKRNLCALLCISLTVLKFINKSHAYKNEYTQDGHDNILKSAAVLKSSVHADDTAFVE